MAYFAEKKKKNSIFSIEKKNQYSEKYNFRVKIGYDLKIFNLF